MLPQPYSTFPLFSGKRAHIGLTGSVAAYKVLDLLRLFQQSSLDVGCTFTRAAGSFIGPLSASGLGADPVYDASCYQPLDNPFAHLTGHQKIDLFLVAPASANILAKAASGVADDLLSTQILSYPASVVFAPAMNPDMWNNSATQRNADLLARYGHKLILPEQGSVACGQEGQGRLPSLLQLYYLSLKELVDQDLRGQKVLVTAGPTREYFDLVRYWSSPSSGKMGLYLALALWLRGAQINFVHGPMDSLIAFPDFYLHPVTSASEMYQCCQDLWPESHLGIFSAAVSDFAPEACPDLKFKKSGHSHLNLQFKQNRDILSKLSLNHKKVGQRIVGFAAEADNLENHAYNKLQAKDMDLIVANLVSSEKSPFNSDYNQVLILDRMGNRHHLPRMCKSELAWRIADWISDL